MLRRFLASLAALALIVSPLAVSASATVIGTLAEVDLLTASEYALTAGSASGTFSTPVSGTISSATPVWKWVPCDPWSEVRSITVTIRCSSRPGTVQASLFSGSGSNKSMTLVSSSGDAYTYSVSNLSDSLSFVQIQVYPGSGSFTYFDIVSCSAVVVTEETPPGDYSAQIAQIVYYIGLVAGILVFFTVVLLCFFSYKFLRIFF